MARCERGICTGMYFTGRQGKVFTCLNIQVAASINDAAL